MKVYWIAYHVSMSHQRQIEDINRNLIQHCANTLAITCQREKISMWPSCDTFHLHPIHRWVSSLTTVFILVILHANRFIYQWSKVSMKLYSTYPNRLAILFNGYPHTIELMLFIKWLWLSASFTVVLLPHFPLTTWIQFD